MSPLPCLLLHHPPLLPPSSHPPPSPSPVVSLQNSNTFRTRYCYTERTDEVLSKHMALLRHLYKHYSQAYQAEHSRLSSAELMSVGEWIALLDHLGLFATDQLTAEQGRLIFMWSRCGGRHAVAPPRASHPAACVGSARSKITWTRARSAFATCPSRTSWRFAPPLPLPRPSPPPLAASGAALACVGCGESGDAHRAPHGRRGEGGARARRRRVHDQPAGAPPPHPILPTALAPSRKPTRLPLHDPAQDSAPNEFRNFVTSRRHEWDQPPTQARTG